MTFEEWWESVSFKNDIRFKYNKEKFKVAYEAGRDQGYDDCYKDHNLGFFSKS